jgi:hypothetical protein
VKIIRDSKLAGIAMTFETPSEVLKEMVKAYEKSHWLRRYIGSAFLDPGWMGRSFRSIKDLDEAFDKPWEQGVQRVNVMLEKVRQEVPPPVSRKRKQVWNEDDGDVDVDRALRGDDMIFRAPRRRHVHTTMQIALLCNLDAMGADTPEQVFWRGAGAVAAADLLEEAGYSVEIWLWCRGSSVYARPYPNQLTVARLKEAGASLDISVVISSLSAWFLRTAVFGSFGLGPVASIGGAVYDLGPWRKYMDVTEGVREVLMPVVSTERDAINMAKRLLAEASRPEE